MSKKLAAIFSAALLCCMLAACGSSFNAVDLLQTNLDILYKGTYSESGLKQTVTTAEEADAMYQNGIELEVQYFAKYFDIDLTLLSDETRQQIADMYRKIYAAAKYTPGEQTADGDNYQVALTIEPINIMQDFLNEDADAVMENWQQQINAGEFDTMTDEEREEIWAKGIIEAVSARADNITYAAPVTIRIDIAPNDDGSYTITDESMELLDKTIIAY